MGAKVFVCSTVYDFRDLRSAFKLWLEEYGYEVFLSEYNDFPQLPSKSSYESCLGAIGQCDYFVLFIGGRVGGWYDRPNNVSITMQEYRHAYEQLKRGKLKLLVFVRKEIWDMREDRQALKTYLENELVMERELSTEVRAQLVNHPSKLLNNADFIFAFLDEVGRVPEMKQAANGGGKFPAGNWIYQFASFRDIVDTCRSILNLKGNLHQKALCANLKHEIESILAELFDRNQERIEPVTKLSMLARGCLTGQYNGTSSYKGDYLIWLGMFLLTSSRLGKNLNVTALQESIASGEFLYFDKKSGTHIVGSLQQALLRLDLEIDRLRGFATGWNMEKVIRRLNDQTIKNNRDCQFTLENQLLAIPFAIHDRIENIIQLCRAIYFALDGNESFLTSAQLHPSTPFSEEAERMKKSQCSPEDTERWLNQNGQITTSEK